MIINIVKNPLKDGKKHNGYSVNSGKITFNNIAIERGIDEGRKIYLKYDTGYSVNIPENYIGILVPVKGFENTSLYQPATKIFTAGLNSINGVFKIDTTSIPAVIPEETETFDLFIVPAVQELEIAEDLVEAEELVAEEMEAE